MSSLIGIFALIVGVLAQGSEYSWGTVKTAWVQLPGRISIVVGQLTSLAILSLVMALALIAVDSLASYLMGRLIRVEQLAVSARFLKGIGAAWLILYLLAVLGFGLATLFKQSAMAIGLGLAYVLVIENWCSASSQISVTLEPDPAVVSDLQRRLPPGFVWER